MCYINVVFETQCISRSRPIVVVVQDVDYVDVEAQLAKFSGPTAGFRRQFDRSAGGSRRRTDSGSAKRRDSGLLAANGRLVAAARQKAAFTLARPLGVGGSLGFANNRFWVPPNALNHRLVPSLLTNVSWGKWTPGDCLFSYAVYSVSKTTLLWLATSSTLIISVSAVHFHPRLDEEQLSAAQFWDSSGHYQRRGERWPTTYSRRSGAHCSARRRDRPASWLTTLQWTPFRPRRRRNRQHVPGTSEAPAAVSFSRHGIQHDWKDNFWGFMFPQVLQRY